MKSQRDIINTPQSAGHRAHNIMQCRYYKFHRKSKFELWIFYKMFLRKCSIFTSFWIFSKMFNFWHNLEFLIKYLIFDNIVTPLSNTACLVHKHLEQNYLYHQNHQRKIQCCNRFCLSKLDKKINSDYGLPKIKMRSVSGWILPSNCNSNAIDHGGLSPLKFAMVPNFSFALISRSSVEVNNRCRSI